MRLIYPMKVIWEDKKLTQEALAGPCVIFSNHNSLVDGLYLTRYLKKYKVSTYVAKDWYDKPQFNWIFRSTPYIPMERKQLDTSWMEEGKEKLRNRESVYIFPEGHLTGQDEFDEFKPGFLMLAKQTDATLIPIYLEKGFRLFHRTRVVIGKPLLLDLKEKGRPSQVLKKHAETCRRQVILLGAMIK